MPVAALCELNTPHLPGAAARAVRAAGLLTSAGQPAAFAIGYRGRGASATMLPRSDAIAALARGVEEAAAEGMKLRDLRAPDVVLLAEALEVAGARGAAGRRVACVCAAEARFCSLAPQLRLRALKDNEGPAAGQAVPQAAKAARVEKAAEKAAEGGNGKEAPSNARDRK